MQKILIVDDEPMMLKVATKILSKKYQIICAMSGADALEIISEEKPDLILSDLIMPKMDGYEFYQKLQEKFAELIKNSIRATDTAGRMGGDEFIAFCENIHDEKIIAEKTKFLNEKILEAAKDFIGKNFEIPLGVSIGAVFVPDEGTEFKILCEKADNALYTVKRRGKHDFAIYSDEDSDKNFLRTQRRARRILS